MIFGQCSRCGGSLTARHRCVPLRRETEQRIVTVQQKLESMGVKDVKLVKDAERWNELSRDERGNLLCDIFEAWMRGECSPFPGLGDSAQETGTALCADCGQAGDLIDFNGKRIHDVCPEMNRRSAPACVQCGGSRWIASTDHSSVACPLCSL